MATYDKKTRSWRTDVSVNGKRYRKRGFLSRKMAEVWEARQFWNHERKMLDLPVEEDEVLVEDIINDFLRHSEKYKKKKASNRDKTCLKHWKEFLDKNSIRYAGELEPKIVEQFIEWRQSRYTTKGVPPSNRTLNLDMETFRRALCFAKERKVIRENPIPKMPLFKKIKPKKPRCLCLKEIEIIEEEAKKDTRKTCFADAIGILIRTGLRSGELCGLEIDDIDFETRIIFLRGDTTKTGMDREVPFCNRVYELLQGLIKRAKKAGRQHLIYTATGRRQTPGGLMQRFRNLLTRLEDSGKIKNTKEINIHTTRKSYISHMMMVEAPVKVMEVVGHRQWSTTKRYLNVIDTVNPNLLPY